MRTLKKTLCLVLCLVMMVGLCAIGANAVDFTDEEQITYKEAVALLSGIGVINGKPDGESFKFDPKGTLTRAEAAKIICYLHDMQDVTGTANFTDTVGHWAEGPIAYCASKGIVAGYGDGTFGPDDTLKGYQFGKMLLCALGFNAEYEKLVGADFEINCATLLKTKKLLTGIDNFDGQKDLTRETAAQMAFNALSAAEVNYPAGAMTVKTGDGTEINVGAGNWFDTADRLTSICPSPLARWLPMSLLSTACPPPTAPRPAPPPRRAMPTTSASTTMAACSRSSTRPALLRTRLSMPMRI